MLTAGIGPAASGQHRSAAVVWNPLGLAVTRAAEGLGVTRQALSELPNGRTVVLVEMVIRSSKAFGSTPGDLAGDADGLRSVAG